jgi:nitrate reductase gamma subunit
LTDAGVSEQPPATGPAIMPIALGVAALCAVGLLAMLARRAVRQRERAVAM